MCGDDNKGDLSIIENTISVLKKNIPNSQITIQNGDYLKEDLYHYKKNIHSKNLCDYYFGSFFPKVYSHPEHNNLIPLINLIKNFTLSLWLIINTFLFSKTKNKIHFPIPKKHKDAWKDLTECDLVVVKGGSYIYSYSGLKQILFLFRMLYTPFISVILKKKMILLGHSIGPSIGLLNRCFIKFILMKAEKIIVRERISYEYITNILKLDKNNLVIIPDMAFISELSSHKEQKEVLKKITALENIKKVNPHDFLVGMTVREWGFPGKKNPEKLKNSYLQIMVDTINFLRKKYHAKIIFVPHCRDDLKTTLLVHNRLEDKHDIHILKGDYTTKELRDMIGCFKLLIGTRIHSVIFALSQCTPSIAIAYEIHKGYGILEMVGQRRYVLNIAKLNKKVLFSKIDEIANHHELIKSEINENIIKLKSEIKIKIAKYLFK